MDILTQAFIRDAAHKEMASDLQKKLFSVGVYTEVFHSVNNYVVQGIEWKAQIGFCAGRPDLGLFEVSGCIIDEKKMLLSDEIVALAADFFNEEEDPNVASYETLEAAGEDLIENLKDIVGNRYHANENGDPNVFEARKEQIIGDVIEILRVSGYLKGGVQ